MDKLVMKAKKGDKDSFSQLIYIYQNDLYRLAKSRLNEEQDVYDVIQETIISAYESIQKLHKPSSFKSWLFKILINKCNDVYKNKTNDIELDENLKLVNNSSSSFELNEYLNILSNDEKTIIILHFIEGYSFKEISKILEINENTVRSKLHRAKAKIINFDKEDK